MNLIDHTRACLRTIGLQHARPAVLWSGGKDSMVLLHLARSLGQPEVVHCRLPWFPAKYEFVDRVARAWSLAVHNPPLVGVTWQKAQRVGGTAILEPIFWFGFSGGPVAMPLNLVAPPAQGTVPPLCGLADIARAPTAQAVHSPWDALIIGHRSADVDPLLGEVPLLAYGRPHPTGPALYFPLRDWTEADVWAYIEAHAVPYQEDRYTPAAGGWIENPDKTTNPDYLEACTRCLKPGLAEPVLCPRLGFEIAPAGHLLPWTINLRPGYVAPAPAVLESAP